jgi:hypothetical protein
VAWHVARRGIDLPTEFWPENQKGRKGMGWDRPDVDSRVLLKCTVGKGCEGVD